VIYGSSLSQFPSQPSVEAPSSERAAADRCVACGGGPVAAWRTATPSDPRLAARALYRLEQCAACGTAAIVGEHRGDESGALYSEGTYAPRPGRLHAFVKLARAVVLKDRMRFLRGVPPHASVLEVGAGDGRFLAALARAGFSVRGIEPSEARAVAARQRGLPIDFVAVEEAEVPAGSLHAVVLWHVLEHLGDPAGVLGRVRPWLRPGGRLIVAVPNLASLQARLGGDRWFHQDVPRHLTHFSARGITALVERSGFELGRVRHVLVEHNTLGMWQTLLNLLTAEPNAFYGFVKRNLRYRGRLEALRDLALVGIAGPLLLPAAGVLELAAGLAGRGGTIVIEARAR
jgi:2-polyprenyl-3-methyl-5-hydroxy-6-metoxy-1,4-benzoquinol methylase